MKKLAIKNFIRKMLCSILILILIAFTIPQRVFADDDGGWSLGGALLKEIVQLISSVGDIAMGALNNFMLGAEGMGSAMLGQSDINMQTEGSWIYDDGTKHDEYIKFDKGVINTKSFFGDDGFEIPNMLYSPENIFANNIAALDVNFLRANEFEAITSGEEAENKSESAASQLRTVIASWYKSFRNIAIVGLLSVLIYLGIRIVISSTADDKAKYKESIKSWVVALCLVFIIHFIMSGILMLTDRVTDLFGDNINQGIGVEVHLENPGENQKDVVYFNTNLMGLLRFQAQSYDWQDATAYTIVYLMLVVFTFRFTFMYFKRFLYTAFFTMISPLVALTYPIDKAGDGKAQAFNMWFKEYTMNVIIQPVHLILYTVFVGSVPELAIQNPIYAIVAIGFMIPAEKFIKRMFKLDGAESTGDFGSFAGGALAMTGFNKVKGLIGGSSSKGGNSNAGGNNQNEDTGKIFTKDRKQLGSFTNNQNQNTNSNTNTNDIKDDKQQTENDDVKYNQNDSSNSNNMNNTIDNNSNNSIDDNTNPILTQNSSNNGLPTKRPMTKKEKLRLAKDIGKVALKGSLKAAKLGAKGAGLVGGAIAGTAIGAATGEPSKAFQYAGIGAGIGTVAAGGLASLPEKGYNAAKNGISAIQQKGDDLMYEYDKRRYGEEYATQQKIDSHNARARRAFLKNSDEQAKYASMASKLQYNGEEKEFMNAVFDLKEAGVQDEELIKNALKVEMERDNGQVGGNSHQNVIDVASFSEKNNYGRDYVEDDKKRETLDNVIDSTVEDENAKREVGLIHAQLYGREKLYKQKSRFFKKK